MEPSHKVTIVKFITGEIIITKVTEETEDTIILQNAAMVTPNGFIPYMPFCDAHWEGEDGYYFEESKGSVMNVYTPTQSMIDHYEEFVKEVSKPDTLLVTPEKKLYVPGQ